MPGLGTPGTATVSVADVFGTAQGREFIQSSQDRKKRRGIAGNLLYPVAAAGLAAGGYGLSRLGDSAISPEDRKRLQGFINYAESPESTDGTPENWLRYNEVGSAAGAIRPFGKSIADVVLAIRTSPRLGRLVPGFAVDSSDRRAVESAAHHYTSFAAGAVPATLHQYDKLTAGDNGQGATNWLFSASNAEKVAPVAPPEVVGTFLKNLPKYRAGGVPAFSALIRSRLGDFAKAKYGTDLDSLAAMPQHVQASSLREFNEYLRTNDPDLYAQKYVADSVLSDAQKGPAKMYALGGKVLTRGLQDAPRIIGGAAMIAGGALGTWWLANKIRAELDRRRKLKSPLVTVPVKTAGLLDGDPVIRVPALQIPVQGAATNWPARVRTSIAENNGATDYVAGDNIDDILGQWNQTYSRMPTAEQAKWDTEIHGLGRSMAGREVPSSELDTRLYNQLSAKGMVSGQEWNDTFGAKGYPRNTPAGMASILGRAVKPPPKRPATPISAVTRTAAQPPPEKPAPAKAPKPAPVVPSKPGFKPRTILPPGYKGPRPPGT